MSNPVKEINKKDQPLRNGNTGVVLSLLGVTRNTDNYGVRVLLSSAIDLLSSVHPDAEIVLLDYGRESQVWYEQTSVGERMVRLINLRFSWRVYLPNNLFRLLAMVLLLRLLPSSWRRRLVNRNRWLRRIMSVTKHYAIAGGDSFSDMYGLRRFLYVALPQVLVLLLRRPLILLPQTFGPFKSRVARVLAAWIVCRATHVTSRDEEGLHPVQALTGHRISPHFSPDIGFCLRPDPVPAPAVQVVSALRNKGPVVGLNPSSLLWMGGYTGNNMFHLRDPFPELIGFLMKSIITDLEATVLLVPHVCGGIDSQEDETRLCQRLLAEYSPCFGTALAYSDHRLSPQETKGLISMCDIFIGARMHACIAAASQGVPTVCLAYSLKFAGVMKPLGAGVQVVDLRKAGAQEVLSIVKNAFLNREKYRDDLCTSSRFVKNQIRAHFGLPALEDS